MVFTISLRLERDFRLCLLALVIPDPIFHFLSLDDLSRSFQRPSFFTRLSFPPLDRLYGRQPGVWALVLSLKRLLALEDQ